MKTLTSGLALAAALLALGSSAMAADDAMMAHPDMTNVATMMCRPAGTGEKANAMTSSNAALVCKPVDITKMMAMKKAIEAMPNGEPVWLKMFQDYHIDANGV
jgi:hypothetical protein